MNQTAIIEKINGFLVEEFEVEAGKIVPEANLREAWFRIRHTSPGGGVE